MGLIKPFFLGLRHRQHRLPRRPADARRHAGRRPGDDQRRRGQLGRRHRGRLPRHPAAHRADVLMADRTARTRPALLDEALGPGGPIIVFDSVWLAFDDKVILRDVSFTLQTGHTKIFLGASGAGKSTILRLILGLLKPDAGRIFVNGERDRRDARGRADGACAPTSGMVFQEGALFDSLTVRENVGYKLFEELDWPIDKANARVEEVLGLHRPRRVHRPDAVGAVRRAAPARGDRPGDGGQAADPALRRADDRARSDHGADRRRGDHQAARPRGGQLDPGHAPAARRVLRRRAHRRSANGRGRDVRPRRRATRPTRRSSSCCATAGSRSRATPPSCARRPRRIRYIHAFLS